MSNQNLDKLSLTALVKLIEKDANESKNFTLLELCDHLKIKLLSLSELLKRKETENVNLKQKLGVFEKLNSNAIGMADENEKLVLELEKLKNEFNILKIELEENKQTNIEKTRHNEIRSMGKEDLEKLNKQYETEIKNNWETIKEYQFELEKKSKELENFKKNMYFNIESPVAAETKDEVIYALQKEIEYLRGTSIHLIDNFVPDETVKGIINAVYAVRQTNKSNDIVFETTNTSRVDEECLIGLKCANDELKSVIKDLTGKNEACKQNLAECKYYLIACYDDLENYKKKEAIKNKLGNREVYEKAIKNIDTLDEKLKSVYSHVIDLFMDLSKQRLVKVEKELNDCIIEYKEIKKIILD